jgi:hypothetical protein
MTDWRGIRAWSGHHRQSDERITARDHRGQRRERHTRPCCPTVTASLRILSDPNIFGIWSGNYPSLFGPGRRAGTRKQRSPLDGEGGGNFLPLPLI